MKKIACLGAGAWGYCLANLLAGNGHQVTVWAKDPALIDALKQGEEHPKFLGYPISSRLHFTASIKEAIKDTDIIIESVTSTGFRSVLTQIVPLRAPIVITSKGIEQKTGLLLPEIAIELCGKNFRENVACLSGPSLAEEVMQKFPASVVSASFSKDLRDFVVNLFSTPYFRVYPNSDLMGVAFGGAMKNIISIACGISDGLGFGQNSKGALMSRGLHEMRKLISIKGASPDTLIGLSGLGDLCATCLSDLSRNYRFGKLIGEGVPIDQAKKKIKMVVEGASTCVSARELGRRENIPLPITESVYSILYEGLDPQLAVRTLFQREIKEEHL